MEYHGNSSLFLSYKKQVHGKNGLMMISCRVVASMGQQGAGTSETIATSWEPFAPSQEPTPEEFEVDLVHP